VIIRQLADHLLGGIQKECMWHALETKEMQTKFWSERLKGRDHSEDLGVYEKR